VARATSAELAGRALPLEGRKLLAYLELTKPRVTVMIFLVTIAAFRLGSPAQTDGWRLLCTVAGVGLLAAGIFSLNQYIERDIDAVMRRTGMRPLPRGELKPREALCFGLVLTILGVAMLALLVNALSALLAVCTLVGYLFVYTPLKTRTPYCTLAGAFPGAMPPLLGWAAARGEMGGGAWALFAILFLWQFPHFHAIARLYREDYERAGVRMLPVVESTGNQTGRQIVLSALLLVPASVAPALLGLTGSVYLGGAILLSLWFLYFGVRSFRAASRWQAQRLLGVSIVYLPALFLLMVLDAR
jgi:heme o synthase